MGLGEEDLKDDGKLLGGFRRGRAGWGGGGEFEPHFKGSELVGEKGDGRDSGGGGAGTSG